MLLEVGHCNYYKSINSLTFRVFLSSRNTSGIFQSHFSRSLWQIIDNTDRIEVSGLNNLSQILMSHIARYIEDGFSLLKYKIRELHPVQRATLGALLRHLLCLASYRNEKRTPVTVEALSWQFRDIILGRNAVRQGKGPAERRARRPRYEACCPGIEQRHFGFRQKGSLDETHG